jgi:N-methylhydantoinase A/oxoprolinase/acetone carboxylase beta subunit
MKTAAPISQKHTIFWKKKFYKAYLYQREYLKNEIIIGPAIIVEYSSTTFIPPGWSCQKPKGSLNLTLKKKKLFDKL